MMTNKDKANKAKEESDQMSQRYRHVFNTPEGEAVLADLREAFYDVNLVRQDSNAVLQLVGAHSAIRYILPMMEPT